MCDCGCNTCETKSTLMLNESLAPRDILSEGLKYHMDANKPLTEHLYRAGSDSYFNLWAEARSLYSRNILEITHEDDLAVLTETDLGHYGMFEGKKVPLDFPIELNEQMDIYDDIANMEFGMDYDQLGDNEKEWVRDEIDNMEMRESYDRSKMLDLVSHRLFDKDYKKLNDEEKNKAEKEAKIHNLINEAFSGFLRNPEDPDSEKFEPTGSVAEFKEDLRALFGKFKGDLKNPEFIKGVAQIMVSWKSLLRSQLDEAKKDIYDKFLDNPQNPKGRAKTIISKFLKQYGENATGMAVDRFAKQNDLKPEEKYILKYITKQDIKISSQPGGPDFSALGEAKKKAKKNTKKLNKPMRDSSGGKAYKVYVKDPKTKKIKTVRFGSGGLRAKINDKEARNAFAARHKCSTKKDKTKAGYWSCRLPRYAKLLGLKSNFGGFW